MISLAHIYCIQKLIDSSQPAFACSKLTIEALEQGVKYVESSFWCRYFTPCSCVSIVNFKHIIAGWVSSEYLEIFISTHFSPGLHFHMETSHSIWKATEMTVFYRKYNTG